MGKSSVMNKPKLILVLGDINFQTEGGLLSNEDESKWFYFEPRPDGHVFLYEDDTAWPDFGRSCDVKQFTGQDTDRMSTFEAIWSWGHYYGFHNFDPVPAEFRSESELQEWLADWDVC